MQCRYVVKQSRFLKIHEKTFSSERFLKFLEAEVRILKLNETFKGLHETYERSVKHSKGPNSEKYLKTFKCFRSFLKVPENFAIRIKIFEARGLFRIFCEIF